MIGITAGCDKDGGSSFELQGHKASEFPGLDEPPTVILEDAGSGDKAPLRYRFAIGSEFPLRMTMRMKMSMSLGDNTMPNMPLPGVQMNAQVSVVKVEGGKARLEFVYQGRPELVGGWEGDDAAANPLVESQMRRSLAGLDGMHGFAVITDRGYMVDGDIEPGPQPDPQLSQMLQSMRQALNQLTVPWPEESVGVGARWRVLQHMKMNGFEMYQVGAYRLDKRDGDRVALAVEMWQGAPGQEFRPPGVPEGVKARIREFASTGKGTMAVELQNPVPESAAEMDSRAKMLFEGGGQKQVMSMALSLRIQLSSQ